MPKERRYTLSELESLRRADLQNLYKINGLKGANLSTDTLRETLLNHFASSSYISPNRRTAPSGLNGSTNRSKRVKTFGEKTTGASGVGSIVKGVKDMKRRIPSVPTGKKVSSERSSVVVPSIQEIRDVEDVVVQPEAGPSRPTSPQILVSPSTLVDTSAQLKLLDNRLTRLEIDSSSAGVNSESRVQQLLDERDRVWEQRIRSLEETFEKRVRDLEEKLEERIRTFISTSLVTPVQSGPSGSVPEFRLTEETLTNIVLGKRTQRSISPTLTQTPSAGPSRPSQSPAAKRVRVEEPQQEDMEDDSDVISPHTPSPPHTSTFIVPRTPSPSHQGTIQDQSRTPGIGSDFFAPPSQFASTSKCPGQDDDERELPYPIFSTTPRPTEPTSPTLDAPPSASRRRIPQYPRASTLTPGPSTRKRNSPAPRAVSEAHKELTTITESDEPPLKVQLASARRRVASADTLTLLGSALRGESSLPISPPQLSPSPSIGAGEQEGGGFTYAPFPPVPRASAPDPQSSRNSGLPPVSTTKTKRNVRATSSPARDYMDVAMYGLLGQNEGEMDDSPSTMIRRIDDHNGITTPGHRTMLGTERYRDTRFGDVPVVQWGTPSVDLGPGTPATGFRSGW